MSKSQFALLFAVRRSTRERHFRAALAKCTSKIDEIAGLLTAWPGLYEDDVRFEYYLPRILEFRTQAQRFEAAGEANPKRTAGAIISFYRSTLNPLIKQIMREMSTPPEAGILTTRTLCDFPTSFLPGSELAPRWIAESIKSQFLIRVTGPTEVLGEPNHWETIRAAAMQRVDTEQVRAWELLMRTERQIDGIFEASPLNWAEPYRVTAEEIIENRETAARNMTLVKELIEQANADVELIMIEAADHGEAAVRHAITNTLNIDIGARGYRFNFRKRAVKGVISVAGGTVGLISAIAGTVASGGAAAPSLYFSAYTVVTAIAGLASVVRESQLGMASTGRQLDFIIRDCQRVMNDKARIEARLREVFTAAATMMKIPSDIYGDVVGTAGNAERYLGQYQNHLSKFMKDANALMYKLHELIDICQAIEAACNASVEGFEQDAYERAIAPIQVDVMEHLWEAGDKLAQQEDCLAFATKAAVVVNAYNSFATGPLQSKYSNLEEVLSLGSDIKNIENVYVGITFGVEKMNTPINKVFPTDVVDVLAMLAN